MARVTFGSFPQAFLHSLDTAAKNAYWLDSSSASKVITSPFVRSENSTLLGFVAAASVHSLAFLILDVGAVEKRVVRKS